jgi:beta-lactamase superfamily II metal-dependent hydrolase
MISKGSVYAALSTIATLLAACATEGSVRGSTVPATPSPPQTASLVLQPLPSPPPPPPSAAAEGPPKVANLTVYAIDIGQGDSTLIVGPGSGLDRKVLLIDAGPLSKPDAGEVVTQFLKSQSIDHVDYVILSHLDADHVGGFAASNGSTSVLWPASSGCKTNKTQWFPRIAAYQHAAKKYDTNAAKDWNDCIASVPKRVFVTKGSGLGDTLDLGGGYTARIIAGDGYVLDRNDRVPQVGSENSLSIVTLISGPGGFEFLVPGDATGQPGGDEKAEVEVAVADYLKANNIDLEILRVGHHGAENTSNPKFLAVAKPEVAIISVGDEQPPKFKHPRCKTYEALAAANINYVLQTETGKPDCAKPAGTPVIAHGTIQIDVAGSDYKISKVGGGSDIDLSCNLSGCSAAAPSPIPQQPGNCCKRCKSSKPCGDACIPASAACTKPQGCACAAQ